MADIDKIKEARKKAEEKGDFAAIELFDSMLQQAQQQGAIEKATEPEFKFSARETISNIPSSAMQYGQNIAQAVTSPIETVKNIGMLGLGTAEKLVPGRQQAEAYPEALGQYFANRYGSQENALKALQTDPVGVLGDVSAFLTGSGAAIPKIGGAVSKAGAAVEPLNVAANVAGYGASKVLPKTLPPKLYESAAKWSTTLPQEERTALTQTALEQQVMPTMKGVTQLQQRIDALGSQIDSLVANATQAGATIPSTEVFKYINDVKSKLGGAKIEAKSDVATVNQIATDFRKYLGKLKKDTLTPEELQAFKTDAYKRIDFERGTEKASIPKQETYKAMAKAAKESLQDVVPEIKALNQEQGQLLELSPYLSRAASRIENRDLIGIGAPIKTGAGGVVGNELGAAAGAAQSILDAPKAKAWMALQLAKRQKQGLGMFLDNSTRNALLRQYLQEQGQVNQAMPGLLGQ